MIDVVGRQNLKSVCVSKMLLLFDWSDAQGMYAGKIIQNVVVGGPLFDSVKRKGRNGGEKASKELRQQTRDRKSVWQAHLQRWTVRGSHP